MCRSAEAVAFLQVFSAQQVCLPSRPAANQRRADSSVPVRAVLRPVARACLHNHRTDLRMHWPVNPFTCVY